MTAAGGTVGLVWDVFDAAPDAMIVVDALERIAFVNAQVERVFGYTRAEITGKSIETLIPTRFPSVRPMGAGVELTGRRKNGEEFPVEVALTSIEGGDTTIAAVRDITARKQAEDGLRRSGENRAKTQDGDLAWTELDCAPLTIVRLNRRAQITHVNKAWHKFARENGADAQTVEGVGLDYVAAASRSRDTRATAVAEALADLVAGRRESFTCIYACHSPTALRWFRLDAQRVAGDAVVLIHSDITVQYLAEARVRVQSALAQALADRLPLVETCRRLSRMACEGLEWDSAAIWTPGEGERLHCVDLFTKAECDAAAFDQATRSATYELGRGVPGKVWARSAPGWTTNVTADPNEGRASLAAAAGFKTAFAVPVGTDETVLAVIELFSRLQLARDDALADLLAASGRQLGTHVMRERAQDNFRQILDAIADLVLVKGPGSKIIWANRAFRDLYGMSNESLQGIVDAPFVEPDHTQQYVRDDALVFSTGKTLVTEEPATRFDGQILRFRTQKSPIFDASGNVVMTVGVSHDITEQKRLEDELHLAARMASVGTLAAGVAHEINTPIQFVSDSIHFLRDAVRDLFGLLQELQKVHRMAADAGVQAADLQEVITAAEEETDLPYLRENVPKAFERCLDGLERVSTIVRSMKEFAHPAQQEMAPVDLNRAIENTLIIARNEYKYVAALETEFNDLPPVNCLVSEIDQVVLNLIVNAAHAIGDAIKGTEKKGTLKVRTWREGPHVIISISDTGTGIPAAIAGRIFEPFFTTKEVGKGTGQGLAIAWAVVKEKHGGELTFESHVGRGTTFFIRLPIAGKNSNT